MPKTEEKMYLLFVSRVGNAAFVYRHYPCVERAFIVIYIHFHSGGDTEIAVQIEAFLSV